MRFTKKTPGKVSGILMCTFGGIGTAGFGIALFCEAYNANFHIFSSHIFPIFIYSRLFSIVIL